ncbi:MAG: molybdopterin oxidoreductase, partial [Rhizobacter sp.]|nr:molybdopterin oxidoreductase [Rhizobacter sp.]
LTTLCSILQVAIKQGRSGGLDWLLDLGDATVTYRSRYLVAPEWMPVLDLLLRDEGNPRSVAFQVKGLVDFIGKLEATHGSFGSHVLEKGRSTLAALSATDLDPESPRLAALLDELQAASRNLSDELSLKFFSHAQSRSVLSVIS